MSEHNTIEPDYGVSKKKLGIYTFGTLLCIILTLIPFAMVLQGTFAKGSTFLVILGFAVVQVIVQVVCFLRLNAQTEQGKMNLMSFIFTIVILSAVVLGSVWIMMNLGYNMMH